MSWWHMESPAAVQRLGPKGVPVGSRGAIAAPATALPPPPRPGWDLRQGLAKPMEKQSQLSWKKQPHRKLLRTIMATFPPALPIPSKTRQHYSQPSEISPRRWLSKYSRQYWKKDPSSPTNPGDMGRPSQSRLQRNLSPSPHLGHLCRPKSLQDHRWRKPHRDQATSHLHCGSGNLEPRNRR